MKAIEPRERLVWHLREAFADRRPPVVATAHAMGTTGGLFYLSGALAALFVTAQFPARGVYLAAELVVVSAAAVSGGAVFFFGHRFPRGAYQLMNLAGTLMVTLLVVLAPSTEPASLLAVAYLYVPLYSFFFLPLRQGLAYEVLGDLGIAATAAAGAVPWAEAGVLVLVNLVIAAVVTWLVRAANMAEVDRLTGLLNRAGLQRAVRSTIESARRSGHPLALALFDIDHFDAYNRDHGQVAGDRLLQYFGAELASRAPKGAHVARNNSDGFAVLLPGLDAARAGAMARSWWSHLSGARACSLGVCQLDPGDTFAMFADRARSAVYEAKQAGRATMVVRESHAAQAAELADGLAAGQFVVYYQPIVGLPGRELIGAEALARWEHPDRGIVGPDQFIPLAEECGLIVQLGQVVLAQAMAEAATWPEPMTVSVNASVRELDRDDYAAKVSSLLEETGLAPSRLVIEVTESLLAEGQCVLANIRGLHELGVKVALDDFGTQYSSLRQFSSLPVDYVKIDRSFVAEIHAGSSSAPVVAAICTLAKETGRAIVAEGIEDEHQAAVLTAHGCDNAQGFLYGRPVPARELFLRSGVLVAPGP